jgi:uncharacterized membrane protein YeiB
MFPAIVTLNAFLATAATPVDQILAQVSSVITLMIDVMTGMLANSFFAFLFGCGFVRIGMSLIRKAKKASR